MNSRLSPLQHILTTFPEWRARGNAVTADGWIIATGYHAWRNDKIDWCDAQSTLQLKVKRILTWYYEFPGENIYVGQSFDNRGCRSNEFLNHVLRNMNGSVKILKTIKGYVAHWASCMGYDTILKGHLCQSREAARSSLARLIRKRCEAYLAPWYDFV